MSIESTSLPMCAYFFAILSYICFNKFFVQICKIFLSLKHRKGPSRKHLISTSRQQAFAQMKMEQNSTYGATFCTTS